MPPQYTKNVESCVLCKRTEDNDFKFGKFHDDFGFRVHDNCMLFACGIFQRPKNKLSSKTINGFAKNDILSELRRSCRLKCVHCKGTGASIGCFVKECKEMFHFPCSGEAGCLNLYYGQFRTYCETHRPKLKLTLAEKREKDCSICLMNINFKKPFSFVKSSCCPSSFFHVVCIQSYALNSGYFFKCPLCNNKRKFLSKMLNQGIHVPRRDASWELEEGAFQELLERPECGAKKCKCSAGRKEDRINSYWELLICEYCGSDARHVGCDKNILASATTWICNLCSSIRNRVETEQNIPDSEVSSEMSDNTDSDFEEDAKPSHAQKVVRTRSKDIENSILDRPSTSRERKQIAYMKTEQSVLDSDTDTEEDAKPSYVQNVVRTRSKGIQNPILHQPSTSRVTKEIADITPAVCIIEKLSVAPSTSRETNEKIKREIDPIMYKKTYMLRNLGVRMKCRHKNLKLALQCQECKIFIFEQVEPDKEKWSLRITEYLTFGNDADTFEFLKNSKSAPPDATIDFFRNLITEIDKTYILPDLGLKMKCDHKNLKLGLECPNCKTFIFDQVKQSEEKWSRRIKEYIMSVNDPETSEYLSRTERVYSDSTMDFFSNLLKSDAKIEKPPVKKKHVPPRRKVSATGLQANACKSTCDGAETLPHSKDKEENIKFLPNDSWPLHETQNILPQCSKQSNLDVVFSIRPKISKVNGNAECSSSQKDGKPRKRSLPQPGQKSSKLQSRKRKKNSSEFESNLKQTSIMSFINISSCSTL